MEVPSPLPEREWQGLMSLCTLLVSLCRASFRVARDLSYGGFLETCFFFCSLNAFPVKVTHSVEALGVAWFVGDAGGACSATSFSTLNFVLKSFLITKSCLEIIQFIDSQSPEQLCHILNLQS